MFCDLADSMKLFQQLDPEDLREVIRAYQQTSAEVIQRFDGYIAQHLGDGLLIYFGWPRAHEDDAQRALHGGLGIVEAITMSLNPRLKQEKGMQLTVRLGIHTGPVVVGEMGGSGRQENLATGETVNIAARLEGLAQPNTVVVSSVTERLVRGAFAFEDLGPQVLKGVADPIEIFRVLSPTEVHRDEDESLPDGGVFLIGRNEEVGLLLRRWEQAKEGLGQVVLINGEPGIGKSSLVATMRHHVAQERYTRITFRCSPYHTNSALNPVVTHLEQMLGFERDETSGAKLDKLEQALRTKGLPLEESVPLVATLLSVPLEDRYPALTLSSQQQRQQTLDTLVAWLIEESEKQPALAVWEDLHWADPSTLEILGLVLEQTPTVPMLNVLTFRPEFSPSWPTRSHMTPITLNRLERPQVEALITHMAGDKPLPAEVVEHIVSKTDGVPLYVEELTKMLLTSDLLQEETDQYVLTGPLSTVAIPDTLQDSLMARLDRLNQAKEVAQLGAVIGREFTYEMLRSVSFQDDETVQSGLARLVASELLYQRGRPPRVTYIFKHALVQDAAYESLLKSTRQQHHQRITQVLEEQFAAIAEQQPELLAYHLTEAGMVHPAIDYWLKAGERAIRGSANAEAVSHFRRGLELVEVLPNTPELAQKELALQVPLGAALTAIKGYTAAETKAAYTRAHELCRQVEHTEQVFYVLYGVLNFLYVGVELHQSRELADEALVLAERHVDVMPHMLAHHWMGLTCMSLGELCTAKEHLEIGLSYYDPEQHRQLVYQCGEDPRYEGLHFLGVVNWLMGYPDQAKERTEAAIAWARELAYDHSIAHTLFYAAVVAQFRGDLESLQVRAEELVALSTRQSMPEWLALGTIFSGALMIEQGEAERGTEQIVKGAGIWGPSILTPYILSLCARGYQRIGRLDQAMRVLNEALDAVHRTDECMWEAELHRLQGECLLMQQGNRSHTHENGGEGPEPGFRQALTIARDQEAKSHELRAATSLARLWLSQDKHKDAYDLLAPVYGWFAEGFDTADLIDAKALLDELSKGR
jgi:class 3 adenylate cyclase/predicted ATPase